MWLSPPFLRDVLCRRALLSQPHRSRDNTIPSGVPAADEPEPESHGDMATHGIDLDALLKEVRWETAAARLCASLFGCRCTAFARTHPNNRCSTPPSTC